MNQRSGDLAPVSELRSEDTARVVEALARIACEFKSLARSEMNPDTLGGTAQLAAFAAVQIARAGAGVVEPVPRLAAVVDKVRP